MISYKSMDVNCAGCSSSSISRLAWWFVSLQRVLCLSLLCIVSAANHWDAVSRTQRIVMYFSLGLRWKDRRCNQICDLYIGPMYKGQRQWFTTLLKTKIAKHKLTCNSRFIRLWKVIHEIKFSPYEIVVYSHPLVNPVGSIGDAIGLVVEMCASQSL